MGGEEWRIGCAGEMAEWRGSGVLSPLWVGDGKRWFDGEAIGGCTELFADIVDRHEPVVGTYVPHDVHSLLLLEERRESASANKAERRSNSGIGRKYEHGAVHGGRREVLAPRGAELHGRPLRPGMKDARSG